MTAYQRFILLQKRCLQLLSTLQRVFQQLILSPLPLQFFPSDLQLQLCLDITACRHVIVQQQVDGVWIDNEAVKKKWTAT